eukprot:2560445-Lingulodinium_polyedra.AAC.1
MAGARSSARPEGHGLPVVPLQERPGAGHQCLEGRRCERVAEDCGRGRADGGVPDFKLGGQRRGSAGRMG